MARAGCTPAPRAPLDRAEHAAVDALAAGIGIAALPDRKLMFGAIRARANECIDCHEVERGALLGAFRYELERAPAFETGLALVPARYSPTPAPPRAR